MFKQVKALNLDCAVPDCDKRAVTTARLSINNAPKKTLPCCRKHADAAREDWIAVPNKSMTGTKSIDRIKVLDDLKKLNGLPPYDGFNPCNGDGYFALAIQKEHGMTIAELEEAVGFAKLVSDWQRLRAGFVAKQG